MSIKFRTRTQSLLGGGREETQRIWGRRLSGAQRVMGRTTILCVPLKATGYEFDEVLIGWFLDINFSLLNRHTLFRKGITNVYSKLL